MIPLHKTCPRFKRTAKYGHGNLLPAFLFHVRFFSLRFNFCGTTHCGVYTLESSGQVSIVSLDQGVNVSNTTCKTVRPVI